MFTKIINTTITSSQNLSGIEVGDVVSFKEFSNDKRTLNRHIKMALVVEKKYNVEGLGFRIIYENNKKLFKSTESTIIEEILESVNN